MKPYWVYILTNKINTVLYVGITNNLQRRVYEHKQKLIEGFTKKYNVIKLVDFEEFTDPTDAIAAEKKLKDGIGGKRYNSFNRKTKDGMIYSKNEILRKLRMTLGG